MAWMDVVKITSLWRILKALPLDDGPDTTRAVVLTVNAASCVGMLMCYTTLCVMCLKHDASSKAAVIVTLAGMIGGVSSALLGFAMNMQKARDALNAPRRDGDGETSVQR